MTILRWPAREKIIKKRDIDSSTCIWKIYGVPKGEMNMANYPWGGNLSAVLDHMGW